jgi:L-asparaginase II
VSAIVEVSRGTVVESVHRLVIAVADGTGRLRASAGDVELVTFARSAIKPIQAIPLVEDGVAARFVLSEEDLALCCASHNGEAIHVAGVLAMLRRFGVEPDALACGPHAPLGEAASRALRQAGKEPERVHNNCSGKHAGMLGLARAHGWPIEGYAQPAHPVQQRMRAEVARWTGVTGESLYEAVDGCGVVTFALPVSAMARGFARLAIAARRGEAEASTILLAMGRHPEYVGGTNRLCSALIRAVDGRIIAKVGAEGVYCAAIPGAELGIALKVVDGATRAAEPALLAVLRAMDMLSDSEMAELSTWAEPFVTNTRGDRVGTIRVSLHLTGA